MRTPAEALNRKTEQVSNVRKLLLGISSLELVASIGCSHNATANDDETAATADLFPSDQARGGELSEEYDTVVIYDSDCPTGVFDGTIWVYLNSGGLYDHETTEGEVFQGIRLQAGTYQNPQVEADAFAAICGEDYTPSNPTPESAVIRIAA